MKRVILHKLGLDVQVTTPQKINIQCEEGKPAVEHFIVYLPEDDVYILIPSEKFKEE